MVRDAFITEPQELEQLFPSCVHHAPPHLTLSLLLQVPVGEAGANSTGLPSCL